MQLRTLAALVWWTTAIALLGGCAATGIEAIEASNPTGNEMLIASEVETPQNYRVFPGDELSIAAVNRPELTITTKVDPFGYIAYPYLGQVQVKDLSPQAVADLLSRGLRDGGYYNRPELRVALGATREQFVYILGEVKRPGAVPVTGKISLLEAIGKAGGQTYDSEMSTVMWIRGSQSPPGVVKLNLGALGDPRSEGPKIPNLVMLPGDVLYIPDSAIASIERFFQRMFNIIRPIVELERGLILYPDVENFLNNETKNNQNNVIIVK